MYINIYQLIVFRGQKVSAKTPPSAQILEMMVPHTFILLFFLSLKFKSDFIVCSLISHTSNCI